MPVVRKASRSARLGPTKFAMVINLKNASALGPNVRGVVAH